MEEEPLDSNELEGRCAKGITSGSGGNFVNLAVEQPILTINMLSPLSQLGPQKSLSMRIAELTNVLLC